MKDYFIVDSHEHHIFIFNARSLQENLEIITWAAIGPMFVFHLYTIVSF